MSWVRICRNCGRPVGMYGAYGADLRHVFSRSILCDVFDSITGNAKEVEVMTVASGDEAFEYRQVILYGAEAIPIPNPNRVRERRNVVMDDEPTYMLFARANVRDGMMTTPRVVESLLERIDRLEADKEKAGR